MEKCFHQRLSGIMLKQKKGNITTDWGDRVGRTVKPRAAEAGGAFVYSRHEFSRRGR